MELGLCKGNLVAIGSMTAFGEETKPKLVDIAICALMHHFFFSIEHIPPSGMDLIVDVNPKMLRCAAMPQYKSLILCKELFLGRPSK